MLLPDDMPMATDISEMTPMDALIVILWLLDHDMAVPVDLIAKAHSGGLYIAH